ncbi:RNA cytidine acetyltransferase [Maniola jurtina]|uniref:RNA cytidine acetyltransferase n=1 Tax=Maniola jurtina TaxID=191418 RepID=UPI001E68D91B|nr:RNA cytidine acetyltransferase [Maniola jurtina]
MVKKKIDNRIRVMIENGVKLGHRTMFLLVGDKSRDQVPILYDMLVKSTVKARPTVLWCYKNKDEAISNHGRKRAKKIAAGKLEVSEESLFDSFRVATTIHGRYYSESHAMLGQTYGVCVLQDFEALTPNLMARTIETVEGGGLIIFLLKTMDSLRQLHSITMDVHSRFKTEAYDTVVNRFNERFLLSLADNPRCLVLDDSLTVLPISSKTAQIEPVDAVPERVNPKLTELVSSLSDTPPAGPLVALCRTYEQATALVALINTLADKQSRPPHCLTAARGRGKSACLGLAVAAAVALGYVNIYVTSPHPENLITLFEFVLRGLDACLYQEHIDYNIVRSTNPDFKKAIVRINIARNSRQTVQYITPDDHSLLSVADLVLVDEAAAIPLVHVAAAAAKAPLGFLSSTVSGYEGTGRALSLKLFAQLQTENNAPPPIKLEEPIRYRAGDPIESWLNSFLCLEAPAPSLGVGSPPPASCELLRVNRDALFCYHRAAEAFLHRLVAIYVASHYKNSPNDIQLLADAPAHCLFVLLAPTPPKSTNMPEILCVIQLCLEGNLSDRSVKDSLGRGRKAAGDLIPWNICEQYGDKDFPKLSGARVVRIATHPSYQRMGYGKRALQQLAAYYSGDIPCLDDAASDDDDAQTDTKAASLHTETIVPRAKPPTLLKRLTEMKPEHLDYLGTSFGLTEELLKFWKSQKYMPVYLSQKANELTGEHSCIMLRSLQDSTWLAAYNADFRQRFSRLLGRAFRKLPASLALSTLLNDSVKINKPELTKQIIEQYLSGHDQSRIESYCRQQADYRLITDLLAPLANIIFHTKVKLKLDAIQQVLFVAMGFQMKDVDDIASELGLPASQILAKFYEACKKINAALNSILEVTVAKEMGIEDKVSDATTQEPMKQSLHEELTKAAKDLERKQRKELSRLMGEDLAQYRIKGSDLDWGQALNTSTQKHIVSVKSGEKRLGEDSKEIDELIEAHSNTKKKKKKHVRNQ